MSITQENHVNGVDTATLFATIGAVREQPELAQFRFRTAHRWVSGTQSEARFPGFYGAGQEHTHQHDTVVTADHPVVLVGNDNGPTPAELLLNALGACLTAGIGNRDAVPEGNARQRLAVNPSLEEPLERSIGSHLHGEPEVLGTCLLEARCQVKLPEAGKKCFIADEAPEHVEHSRALVVYERAEHAQERLLCQIRHVVLAPCRTPNHRAYHACVTLHQLGGGALVPGQAPGHEIALVRLHGLQAASRDDTREGPGGFSGGDAHPSGPR